MCAVQATADIVVIVVRVVRRHVNHYRPHGDPYEAQRGQHEATAVGRHRRHDCAAKYVAQKAAEHRAGEHEGRIRASVRLGYNLLGHRTAARTRRAKRAPGKPIRRRDECFVAADIRKATSVREDVLVCVSSISFGLSSYSTE